MKRLSAFLSALTALAAMPVIAAPPANDNFAARQAITGASATVTGTNAEATMEAGEDDLGGLYGATVWYRWAPPVSGWVWIHTNTSPLDTVIRVTTGTTLTGLTLIGYNDEDPDQSGVSGDFTSSLTFLATGGVTYNIAVGGWVDDFSGLPEEGNFTLRVVSGAGATPAVTPGSISFSPSSANVTAAAVNVTANYTVQAGYYSGAGSASIAFFRPDGSFVLPVESAGRDWITTLPQSGNPFSTFSIPRYSPPGQWTTLLTLNTDAGESLTYGGPTSGEGYVLPGTAGFSRTLTVTNTGSADITEPDATTFDIAPRSVNVTAGSVALNISAVLTDNVAGIATAAVTIENEDGLSLGTALTRTAGTALDGTWTGTINVPRNWPTGTYQVYFYIEDAALNFADFGAFGSYEIPGGDFAISVLGGGAYETWAFTEWFAPTATTAGILDDAGGDGVNNLLCYAFNLNPFDSQDSVGFLPEITVVGTGSDRRLRLRFARRDPAGTSALTYLPQFTSDTAGLWENAAGTPVITDLGGGWQEVVIEDTVTLGASGGRRWGRVKVDYAGSD